MKWAKQTKGGRVGKHRKRLPLTASTDASPQVRQHSEQSSREVVMHWSAITLEHDTRRYIIIGDECLCKQIASSLISPPSECPSSDIVLKCVLCAHHHQRVPSSSSSCNVFAVLVSLIRF